MSRPREKNRHLPKYVTVIHGAYWYRPPGGPYVNIGPEGEEQLVWKFLLERAAPLEPPKPNATLKEFFERYRREILPTKAPRTQKDYARHLTKLETVFGHMQPDELRKRQIGQFLDRVKGKIQANRQVAVLSAVYAKMVGKWYVAEHNPCIGVERNETRRRTRYVTDEEYQAIWTLANPRVRLAMDLALITGQRQGDLLALPFSDVTPDGIKFQQGKTGKKLIVGWSAALEECITRSKGMLPKVDIGGYVLRGERTGKPYTSEGFRAMWQRTMIKAMKRGILTERFTFHDLRAKAVSDSSSLESAFERAGHTTMAMTRGVYDRKHRKVTPLK